MKLREEALSFALFKLRIDYKLFHQSLAYYIGRNQPHVTKLWLGMFTTVTEELSEPYPRELMVQVAQRQATIRREVI